MRCGTIGSCQSAATSEIVKALLVTSLTHVSGAITSVLTFTFTLAWWRSFHHKCNSPPINGQCSLPITVLLYDSPLLCGFNVAIKGLMSTLFNRNIFVSAEFFPSYPYFFSLQTGGLTSTRRSTLGDRACPVASARTWNSLLSSVTNAPSLTTFRRELS